MARRIRYGNVGHARLKPEDMPSAVFEWPSGGDMNKTEASYARTILEPGLMVGEILWYAFEPFKLRLGPKNFYTPDFGVMTSDRRLQLHEVKAVWSTGKVGFKEDARQKIRDAAQCYPFFQFIVAAKRSSKQMRELQSHEQWVYEYMKSHTTKPPPE